MLNIFSFGFSKLISSAVKAFALVLTRCVQEVIQRCLVPKVIVLDSARAELIPSNVDWRLPLTEG